MSSFKDVREAILFAWDDEVVSDDEFVLLYDAYQSKNPDFRHEAYRPFSVDYLDAAECKAEFRFEKRDIHRLAEALQLPPVLKLEQGSVCERMEGLCLLLKRVCYPCRLSDLIQRFGGRPVSVLSLITNRVIDYIYKMHRHRITEWNHAIMNPQTMQIYAEAVSQKGAVLDNCFGFIDGTVRPISKPKRGQRAVYNGHKRVHALKFQSLALPNGLIGNIYGPVEGRRHDAGILVESGLMADLQQHAVSPTRHPFCVYGDLAYLLRVNLQTPFRNMPLTPLMQEYNRSMSKARISVEWLLGDIVNSFKFVDFKKNLKIGLSCVGKMYVVCTLLRNALTCLYNNQTSEYFELDLPTLEEYFQ